MTTTVVEPPVRTVETVEVTTYEAGPPAEFVQLPTPRKLRRLLSVRASVSSSRTTVLSVVGSIGSNNGLYGGNARHILSQPC